jgi:hypothetical protein
VPIAGRKARERWCPWQPRSSRPQAMVQRAGTMGWFIMATPQRNQIWIGSLWGLTPLKPDRYKRTIQTAPYGI